MVAALLDTLLTEVESRTQGLRPRTKDINTSVLKKRASKKFYWQSPEKNLFQKIFQTFYVI